MDSVARLFCWLIKIWMVQVAPWINFIDKKTQTHTHTQNTKRKKNNKKQKTGQKRWTQAQNTRRVFVFPFPSEFPASCTWRKWTRPRCPCSWKRKAVTRQTRHNALCGLIFWQLKHFNFSRSWRKVHSTTTCWQTSWNCVMMQFWCVHNFALQRICCWKIPWMRHNAPGVSRPLQVRCNANLTSCSMHTKIASWHNFRTLTASVSTVDCALQCTKIKTMSISKIRV